MSTPSGFIAGRDLWASEEDRIALDLRAQGKTAAHVASKLSRTVSSVVSRFRLLDKRSAQADPNNPKRVRPCMCCGNNFNSDGPHNRLCLTCRRKDTSPYATF